jgi:hypothetical protein
MEPETHYEAVLEHPELGKLTWGIWEYSLGTETTATPTLEIMRSSRIWRKRG